MKPKPTREQWRAWLRYIGLLPPNRFTRRPKEVAVRWPVHRGVLA